MHLDRKISSVLLALLCGGWPTGASSQVTIDVSKITCEQFTLFKISDPDNIALWIAGFYSGKKNRLTIDVQTLKSNARKLVDYCVVHPKIKLLDAVEPSLASSAQ